MTKSAIEYHLKFMDWFRNTYPELEEKFSGNMVLHLNKPMVTVRSAGLDTTILGRLERVLEEFRKQFG